MSREALSNYNELAGGMAVLTAQELEYVVCCYYEYKRVWTPVLDEMLSTEIERGNPHDEYAVVLILDGLLLDKSCHCPLRHLRDPSSPALGGLRDASALRLSVLQRSEVPVGALDQA